MAAISSISNSDSGGSGKRAGRLPWALIGALAIVGMFEIALHGVDARKLIYYGNDITQREAVREYARLGMTPDLLLVGSSQMRQAVSMPEFTELVNQRVGASIRVGNYALRGGRTDVMRYVVREAVDSPKKPRLIVLGVSVRDFRGDKPDWNAIAPFMRPGDVWIEARENGAGAFATMPVVARQSVFGWCRTVRYRDYLSHFVIDRLYPPRDEGNIALGETARELTFRTRSLASSPMTPTTLRRRMRWSFEMDKPPRPTPAMTDYLLDAARLCREADVELLVVEMPIAPVLRRVLPSGFYTHFQRTMRSLDAQGDIRFIPIETLQPEIPDKQFFDAQHLNYRGAIRFGEVLAPRVAPLLVSPKPEASSTGR